MTITENEMRTALAALGPHGRKTTINALAKAAPRVLDSYDIDTPLRLAHFWAQMSHECAGFRTMHEYWGPTAAQKRYEGRRDLGNTEPGDGKRFMGRGLIQITGRANYQRYGDLIGVDLIADPEKASNPSIALRIACEYWKANKLNKWADRNDIKTITKRINGGYNGLADRRANFVIAWRVFGDGEARPVSGRNLLTSSKEVRAIGASAAGGGLGVYGAYEAGKEGVEQAVELKGTIDVATETFGLTNMEIALILAVFLMAAGLLFLLYARYVRAQEED